MSPSEKREELLLSRIVMQMLAETAYTEGALDLDDFKNESTLRQKLKEWRKRRGPLRISVVYHPTLLQQAKRFIKRGEYDYAYIFFATYFEHIANDIVTTWCDKNNVPIHSRTALLRRLSIEDKYTWLLDVLKLPKFSPTHISTIKFINELRNQFIHYKFSPEKDDLPYDHNKRTWVKERRRIFAAVRYAKFYLTRATFGGKKKHLKVFSKQGG